METVRDSGLGERLHWLRPQPASVQAIERVHTGAYRQFIEEACLSGAMMVDSGETLVGEDSYRAALLSAGGVMLGVDEVVQGRASSAFVATRPPGHHATQDRAMGFCLFNNVAIAARHAQCVHGIERVLIVDWDVHHGNGTQDIFYNDASVFFFSTHQHPLYPGTGSAAEQGVGPGCGYTVNCPMAPGAGFKEYQKAFLETLTPAARRFKPQLMLVSAGFDAHDNDPLADISLHESDFGQLASIVMDIAAELCNQRVVFALEGGYNIPALTASVLAVIDVMVSRSR